MKQTELETNYLKNKADIILRDIRNKETSAVSFTKKKGKNITIK